MIAVAYKNKFVFDMSDYEDLDLEDGENMFGMSIKSDDDDDTDLPGIDPLLVDDPLLEEEEDPLLEEEEVGSFLEDGDEEEIY